MEAGGSGCLPADAIPSWNSDVINLPPNQECAAEMLLTAGSVDLRLRLWGLCVVCGADAPELS